MCCVDMVTGSVGICGSDSDGVKWQAENLIPGHLQEVLEYPTLEVILIFLTLRDTSC